MEISETLTINRDEAIVIANMYKIVETVRANLDAIPEDIQAKLINCQIGLFTGYALNKKVVDLLQYKRGRQ